MTGPPPIPPLFPSPPLSLPLPAGCGRGAAPGRGLGARHPPEGEADVVAAEPHRVRQRDTRVRSPRSDPSVARSEEHTSELQSRLHLVCRLLLEKKKKKTKRP